MTEEIEFKGDAYWEWFYSSKMRIKRKVLNMERVAAKQLNLLLKESKPLNDQRFALDLEWLLTWKLKTKCRQEFMWCDGVEFQKIATIDRRTIRFNGSSWIGPENSDDLFNVPIESEMTLKPNGKAFKSYWFKIDYNGLNIEVKRA